MTILQRHGCSMCGKFTIDVDEWRSRVKMALGKYTRSQTETNLRKLQDAQVKYHNAKRIYDEHIESHSIGNDELRETSDGTVR